MKKLFSLFKNKKFLRGFTIVAVVLLIIGSYIIYQKFTGRVFIDNSLIQAPIINITPSQNGKVEEFLVKEGQKVDKGDALAVVGSSTLRANTQGLIVSASDLTGSSVTTATQLIQMIRPTDLRVAATIDETKGLSDIKVGQVVTFTVDAFPNKTYWGYVDEVSSTAKVDQLAFSVSSERPTQQFIVYAKFDVNKYPEIKNGMSAKMTVYTNSY